MTWLMILIFCFLAIGHAVFFVKLALMRRRLFFGTDTLDKPPGHVDPSLVLRLDGKRGVSAKNITSTLLFFVQSGYASLTRKGDKVCFHAKKAPVYTPGEYIYHFLFFEIGDDGILHVDDVYRYTESDQGRAEFLDALSQWEGKLEEELEDLHWLYVFPTFKKRMIVSHIVMLLLSAVLLFVVAWFGVFALVLTILSFILLLNEPGLTQEGEEELSRWHMYRRYLQEIDSDDHHSPENVSIHFVYAAGFGLIASLKEAFPVREASELSLRTDQFPLYFYAAPGTFALSMESLDLLRDTEDAFNQGLNPGSIPGDAASDSTGLTVE
ncbi:DUF2207 family protein [Salisediminibacterium beveridgei]|uniref:Predicted membrane protein YciQ-like C-terminal domain-containing protein n=1 Tax=Salisediminibacterium beveridgei TaxID=632773 RepID=A0A1D7QVM3_9BACI|nr:DUF2207 domain-containing protein [Salisediminibacterium beveridgei]AOM83060.1 hypothetical protein BBEV_1699 [Salisediminibacterium beveridgei]